MKIQLVQMHPEINLGNQEASKEANLKKIADYVDKGLAAGANLIVFGECALVGYNLDKVKYTELAEPIPGPATELIAQKLKGKHTYVVFGMAEADGSCVYNATPLIGPEGVVNVCRKLYLANFESTITGFLITYNEAACFKPGQKIIICDTEFGRIGMQICLDAGHAELALAQSIAGAWLIIMTSATPLLAGMKDKVPPETKAALGAILSSRAAANEVATLYVSLIGDQAGIPFNGGSAIVMGTQGVVKQASMGGEGKEEVIEAEVDPEDIYKARRRRWDLRDTRVEIIEQLYDIAKEYI